MSCFSSRHFRFPRFHWLRRLVATLGLLAAAFLPVLAAEQKKVIVDFEDVGTWRIKESLGVTPGTWWPAQLSFGASSAVRYRDDYVGELRFDFDAKGAGPFSVGFERHKMSQVSGFLSAIEFEADSRELPVSLTFEIVDAAGKIFRAAPVALKGKGWQHYRVELNKNTVPGLASCKFPARLKRVSLSAATPCRGSVFLDNIALAGTFTRKDQLTATPIYDTICYAPGKPVRLRYRLRSASPDALTGTIKIEVRDFSTRKKHSAEASVSLDAHGQTEVAFDIGALPVGAYEVVLIASAGEYETVLQDHFGVFIPNNGRPNRSPMWFGICDMASWQCDAENGLHRGWMRTMGADIDRVGVFMDRFESQPGVINEGWDKLFQGHADAGIDIMLLYQGCPPWTQSKRNWRGAPDLWPEFDEHAKHVGEYIRKFPVIKWIEFLNEPDVDFFDGTQDQYLQMLKHFRIAMKAVYPEMVILTGGVTVKHPREKPGFSKAMFQLGDLYDIAAYHAHGPAINNEQNQVQVEAWLKEAGLSKHYVNTETGERSMYNAEGRRRQAISLIKKVVYCKSVPGFDAYFWFTLQDYWDMDPEADDSFGLITSDNRAKASFVAYNALINRLANTSPVKSLKADSAKLPVAAAEALEIKGLKIHTFRKDDGRYVYVGWPAESQSSGILWLKTSQSVEVADMFGAIEERTPLGGILPMAFGDQPLYISGQTPGVKLQVCAPSEEFLRFNSEVPVMGTGPVSIPVVFRNPTSETIEGTLTLRDTEGNVAGTGAAGQTAFKVEAGKEFAWPASVDPGKTDSYDTRACQLDLQIAGQSKPTFSFPVQLIGTYLFSKVPELASDPAAWPSMDSVPAIEINRTEQVVELTYDPTIPAWKGPSDLSGIARAAHDSTGIRFRIEVTDDTPGPLQAPDKMWSGDDVQVAFGTATEPSFAIVDLGKSQKGPAVWCSQHPDSKRTGEWTVPFAITQKGNVTVYDVYLPFETLGMPAPAANTPLRFTFMVNENDGKGRVRWIQWKDGIGKHRSLEMLGHGRLE